MTYAVIWSLAAIQQFQGVVQAAADPGSVDQAGAWIDYTLRRIPMEVGESRADPRTRIWYGDVLGVFFRVLPDEMKVHIVAVGPARRRR